MALRRLQQCKRHNIAEFYAVLVKCNNTGDDNQLDYRLHHGAQFTFNDMILFMSAHFFIFGEAHWIEIQKKIYVKYVKTGTLRILKSNAMSNNEQFQIFPLNCYPNINEISASFSKLNFKQK